MELKFEKKYIERYGIGILLFAIFILSFYFRLMPLQKLGNYLQAIDPYYIFRTTQDLVNNDFVLKDVDMLRYYPTGFSPKAELYYLYYIYGILYVLLFKWWGVSFLKYAQIIPALLGASYVILAYFIGKELKDRILGVYSSLAMAVITIIYARSSAGFFEKEPLSGFFVLLSVLFFIKAYKSVRFLDGILFALFTALSYAVWGGAVSLYYLYAAVLLGLWILNKLSWEQAKILALSSVLAAFLYAFMYSKYYMLKSGALGLLTFTGLFVLGIEFYFKRYSISRSSYHNAGILAAIVLFIFIGSFFSATLAKNIDQLYRLIVYKKAVMESTVAENVPANWGYFKGSYYYNVIEFDRFINDKIQLLNSTGMTLIGYLLSLVGLILKPVFFIFSPLVLMLIGLGAMLYESLKNDKNMIIKVLVVFSYAILLLSYYFFIGSQGTFTTANIIYVLASAVIILYVLYKKPLEGTLLAFLLASFLMFVTKVRI
ncbi:MAG: hypothetical protein GXN99_02765, partial [Candidatus Nanohaloarchaeota archaeon]|nr:hypothetical protein [Candidatus Nanohaloarchaeota archaeon]